MLLLFLLFVKYAISTSASAPPLLQDEDELGTSRVSYSCCNHCWKKLIYNFLSPDLQLDWDHDANIAKIREQRNPRRNRATQFDCRLNVRIPFIDNKPEQQAKIVFDNRGPRLILPKLGPQENVEFIKVAPEPPIIRHFFALVTISSFAGILSDQFLFDNPKQLRDPKVPIPAPAQTVLTFLSLFVGLGWQSYKSSQIGRHLNYPSQYQLKLRDQEAKIVVDITDKNKQEFYQNVLLCNQYLGKTNDDVDITKAQNATISRFRRKAYELVLVDILLYTSLWVGSEHAAEYFYKKSGKQNENEIMIWKTIAAFGAYCIFEFIEHKVRHTFARWWNNSSCWTHETWTWEEGERNLTKERMIELLNEFAYEESNYVEVPMVYYNENCHRNVAKSGFLLLKREGEGERFFFRFENGAEYPIEDPQGTAPRFIDTKSCASTAWHNGGGWAALSVKVGEDRINIRTEGDLFCCMVYDKLNETLGVSATTNQLKVRKQFRGIFDVLLGKLVGILLAFVGWRALEIISESKLCEGLSTFLRVVGVPLALPLVLIHIYFRVTNYFIGWKDWSDPELPEVDVGKAIEVEYEGAYYPAKLKADNGDGTFTIIYDETFGEETVEKARIKQEAYAAPAASAFSVGPVQTSASSSANIGHTALSMNVEQGDLEEQMPVTHGACPNHGRNPCPYCKWNIGHQVDHMNDTAAGAQLDSHIQRSD